MGVERVVVGVERVVACPCNPPTLPLLRRTRTVCDLCPFLTPWRGVDLTHGLGE